MDMADFGRSQLLKYGWTEGKGLGKYENGIAEALKPKLKFDTTGVGHDASEYHWWEFIYNKASNNIHIDTESRDVQMKVKDKYAVDIKTSKSELNLGKIKREQDLHYGRFLKTSTLENGKVTIYPDYSVDKCETEGETTEFSVLNDEDLFKACGGRTAHKGARHGLKLNGKLARIERQEQDLLVRLNGIESNTEWVRIEKKKKKKKNLSIDMNVMREVDPLIPKTIVQSTFIPNTEDCLPDIFSPAQSKKTRRKAKRRVENLSYQLKTSLALSTDVPSDCEKVLSAILEESVSSKKARKKLKRKKSHCDTLKNGKITDSEDTMISGNVKCIIEPTVKRYKKEVMEASILNCKIEKRKRNKSAKKERKKLEKLSTNLQTLDLVETSENNDDECENKSEMLKKVSGNRKIEY